MTSMPMNHSEALQRIRETADRTASVFWQAVRAGRVNRAFSTPQEVFFSQEEQWALTRLSEIPAVETAFGKVLLGTSFQLLRGSMAEASGGTGEDRWACDYEALMEYYRTLDSCGADMPEGEEYPYGLMLG